MQDVENNMDDLFRNAAENYKPNPGKSGWNVVQPQLLNHSIASANSAEKKKKNKVLLLLILLPFAAGMLTYHFAFDTAKNSTGVVKNSIEENPGQKQNSSISINETTIKSGINISPQKNTSHFNFNSTLINNKVQSNYALVRKMTEDDVNIEHTKNILPALLNITSEPIINKREKASALQDSAAAKNNNAIEVTNIAVTSTVKKKFYYGLLLGSSFNQVKNQGFKKPGFDAGFIAGYTLSKNLSLETGLQYSKKYYSSDGKYFNMEKMPANMKVLSLKGSCNVFEIPVNIKYNIVHKNASVVFASAGIYSSILTRESNNYIASVNNAAPKKLNGLYKNVSAGLLSSVNLGIGYEHKTGKQNSIRIQPYIQIPLKGIGVGKMQVMGAGMNIAITHPFN